MLVIEGSDCLGKTTAAKRLVDLASAEVNKKFEYRHMGRPNEKFNFGSDYHPMISPLVVQDRFHLGALVWHDNVMTPANLAVVTAKIRAIGGIIVVFTSREMPSEYEQRLQQDKRKQMFGADKIMSANRQYTLMAENPAIVDCHVAVTPFADDIVLKNILSLWFGRLAAAGVL